jgi:hypothetical protein
VHRPAGEEEGERPAVADRPHLQGERCVSVLVF